MEFHFQIFEKDELKLLYLHYQLSLKLRLEKPLQQYFSLQNYTPLLPVFLLNFHYNENLKGKQVIGVCNFAEKNIAGVVSQVLILGSIDNEGKVILVHPSQKSENGIPIA